jgi:hypothetical protein
MLMSVMLCPAFVYSLDYSSTFKFLSKLYYMVSYYQSLCSSTPFASYIYTLSFHFSHYNHLRKHK